MRHYDFITQLAKIVPNYALDKDNEGQVIIYTNLTETDGEYEEII